MSSPNRNRYRNRNRFFGFLELSTLVPSLFDFDFDFDTDFDCLSPIRWQRGSHAGRGRIMMKTSAWDAYLEENGISHEIWNDARYLAKPYATGKVAKFLLGEVNSRKKRHVQGETQLVSRGKAIPDSYVNNLVYHMLFACIM